MKYLKGQSLNIRQVENLDIKTILQGNTRDLLAVLNDLAFIDVENEEYIRTNPEALKLYRLCQYGLQYMMFSISKLKDNQLLLRDYIQIQNDKFNKMNDVLQGQKEKISLLKEKKKIMAHTESQLKDLVKALKMDEKSKLLIDRGRGLKQDFDSDNEKKNQFSHVPLPGKRYPNPRGDQKNRGQDSQPESATKYDYLEETDPLENSENAYRKRDNSASTNTRQVDDKPDQKTSVLDQYNYKRQEEANKLEKEEKNQKDDDDDNFLRNLNSRMGSNARKPNRPKESIDHDLTTSDLKNSSGSVVDEMKKNFDKLDDSEKK